MPDRIENDADIWAACIGGAAQIDSYTSLIESAGSEPREVQANTPHEFISEQAASVCQKYGVKSSSLNIRE